MSPEPCANCARLQQRVTDLEAQLAAFGPAEHNDSLSRLDRYRRALAAGPSVAKLLIHLVDHPDRVHRKEDLVALITRARGGLGDPKIVEVRVSQLRGVLRPFGEEGVIESCRGLGYRVGREAADRIRLRLEPANV